MIQEIPLIVAPSQSMSVQLGGQSCRIAVYQKTTGLYVDLYVSDRLIISGVTAENNNRIVRSIYLGFMGDMYFTDTQGASDPDYTGFDGRFLFAWDSTLA